MNGRGPKRIKWRGRRLTWSEWAVHLGLDPNRGSACFRKRARLGWPVDLILSTPVRRWKAVSF